MLVFCVALTIEGAEGSGVAMRVSEDADSVRVFAGRPLTLTYGVVVWDGDPGPEQVEALYRRWAR
jgi:hypothetical protein